MDNRRKKANQSIDLDNMPFTQSIIVKGSVYEPNLHLVVDVAARDHPDQ